jgi:hypothetical protein
MTTAGSKRAKPILRNIPGARTAAKLPQKYITRRSTSEIRFFSGIKTTGWDFATGATAKGLGEENDPPA